MNLVFTGIIIAAVAVMLFVSPDLAAETIIKGAANGLTFSLKLYGIYTLWLSIMALWRKLNFDKFCAKKLSFAIKKIFPDETDDCYDDLAVNLSANLLGLGSAGTPAGISATKKFRSKKNKIMLLVINSCSIQLIPTTIVALRSTYSATEDIILPTLISTIIGVFVGGLLVKITVKK